MRKSHFLNWIFVAAFLVMGFVNLAFNPFVVQSLHANQDCDDDDQPTCTNCSHPDCNGNDWVCVPDGQPTCAECTHPECQANAWACVDDT
jgi:hypothetical protein